MNLDRSQNLTVADADLQMRGGLGGPAHPDPEIGGGRGQSQFGQFGLKMRGGGVGPSQFPLNPPLLKNFLFPTVCCQKFFQSFVLSH